MDVGIHISFNSALLGGEWSASRPGRFIRGERASGTYWVGGVLDTGASLDNMEKTKLLSLPGLELDPSVVQPLASLYID
jgi:hypothetical protein